MIYLSHLYRQEGFTWVAHPNACLTYTQFMCYPLNQITKLKLKHFSVYNNTYFMKITLNHLNDQFFGAPRN